MPMLPSVFNADQHEAMDDFSPLPVCDDKGNKHRYKGMIIKSEIKPTKAYADKPPADQLAKRLNFSIKVLDGPEGTVNKIHFVGLNIVNPNPTAVEISQKELKSMTEACGKKVIQSSEELHNIPFEFELKEKPATDQYPASSEICKYICLAGTSSGAGGNPFDDEDDVGDPRLEDED